MRIRLRSILMPLVAALCLTASLAVPALAIDPTAACIARCERLWYSCTMYQCLNDDCQHVCDWRYDQCTFGCYPYA